ncbi:protein of unknown function [Thauera humireducens]|nr:protein of unknown function [Thauera humireducens]
MHHVRIKPSDGSQPIVRPEPPLVGRPAPMGEAAGNVRHENILCERDQVPPSTLSQMCSAVRLKHLRRNRRPYDQTIKQAERIRQI